MHVNLYGIHDMYGKYVRCGNSRMHGNLYGIHDMI